jgi:CRP/FNR family transcriptional regulator, cyclic AMP receptor protein
VSRRYERLLQLAPELGAGLTGEELAEARRSAVAPVVTLPPGRRADDELLELVDSVHFGAIVAAGLISHEFELGGRVATYLLGRGDIVAPGVWSSRRLPVRRMFSTADPVRLALLDAVLPALSRSWPSIAGALLVQAERQLEQVSINQLISQLPSADQRIVALLWHLADRWGRPDSRGVIVPLAIGHQAISHMVGGRRPTVSLALARLAERKLVTRRGNGTWLLAPESRSLLDAAPLRTSARRKPSTDRAGVASLGPRSGSG